MAAFIVFAGLSLFFAFAFLALLVKLAIRLVLLPLFLLKWIVTGLVMVVVGPVLALVALVVVCAFALVLAVPLLPVLALGGVIWLLMRSTRRPAVV